MPGNTVEQNDSMAQFHRMANVASREHAGFDGRLGAYRVDEQLAVVIAAEFADAKVLRLWRSQWSRAPD